jgi:hypothetical protein
MFNAKVCLLFIVRYNRANLKFVPEVFNLRDVATRGSKRSPWK